MGKLENNPLDNNTIEKPRTTYGFLRFLFKEIMQKKRYWLLPLWCVLAAIALVLFLAGNGALLPAIYMAF